MPGGIASNHQRSSRTSADCTTSQSRNGGGNGWWWWMALSMTSQCTVSNLTSLCSDNLTSLTSLCSDFCIVACMHQCSVLYMSLIPMSSLAPVPRLPHPTPTPPQPHPTPSERGKALPADLGAEKERIALYALQSQVQEQDKDMLQLVSEHVETRTLYNSAQPGISQVTHVNHTFCATKLNFCS